jgi:hypothetical protein
MTHDHDLKDPNRYLGELVYWTTEAELRDLFAPLAAAGVKLLTVESADRIRARLRVQREVLEVPKP